MCAEGGGRCSWQAGLGPHVCGGVQTGFCWKWRAIRDLNAAGGGDCSSFFRKMSSEGIEEGLEGKRLQVGRKTVVRVSMRWRS